MSFIDSDGDVYAVGGGGSGEKKSDPEKLALHLQCQEVQKQCWRDGDFHSRLPDGWTLQAGKDGGGMMIIFIPKWPGASKPINSNTGATKAEAIAWFEEAIADIQKYDVPCWRDKADAIASSRKPKLKKKA